MSIESQIRIVVKNILELCQIEYSHYKIFGFKPNHHIYYLNYQKIGMAIFWYQTKMAHNILGFTNEKSREFLNQVPS